MAQIKKGLTRLHDLDAVEISLVKRGANRRKFLITKADDEMGEDDVEKAVLSTERRKNLSDSDFALSGRRYPIPDRAHARNALARSSGKPEEAKVRAAVYRKYPEMKKDDVAKGGPGSGPQKGGGKGAASDKSKPKEVGRTQSGKAIYPHANDPRHADFTEQDHLDAMEHHVNAQGPLEGKIQNIERQKMNGTRGGYDHSAQVNAIDQRNNHKKMAQMHSDKADAAKHGVKKSGDAMSKVHKADRKVMSKVEECMKNFRVGKAANAEGEEEGIGDEAESAVRAVARILTPYSDKIPVELLQQVLCAAGYDNTDGSNAPGASHPGDGSQVDGEGNEFSMTPIQVGKSKKKNEGDGEEGEEDEDDDGDEGAEGVTKGHLREAAMKANQTFKDEIEKLGYRKYPDAQMALKTTGGKPDKKSKGESVAKAAEDLSGADQKAHEKKLELIQKKADDTAAENKKLHDRISAMETEGRRKEIVAKAAEFTDVGLPQESLVAQLTLADKAGKESYEMVVKNFETLNKQGSESKLFREIGTSHGGDVSGASGENQSWAAIENAAKSWVQKSGEKISHAEAVDKFLQTDEGQKMYATHKASRKGGA